MKSQMNVPQPQVGGSMPTMGGSAGMPPSAGTQKSRPSPMPMLPGIVGRAMSSVYGPQGMPPQAMARPMMQGPMDRQSMMANYLRGRPQ